MQKCAFRASVSSVLSVVKTNSGVWGFPNQLIRVIGLRKIIWVPLNRGEHSRLNYICASFKEAQNKSKRQISNLRSVRDEFADERNIDRERKRNLVHLWGREEASCMLISF